MMEQEIKSGFLSADAVMLDRLIAEYPWFTSARIRKSALEGVKDEMLALGLFTKPWPAGLLGQWNVLEIPAASDSTEQAPDVKASERSDTDAIIDKFLASGDKKVVPKDDTPLDDVSEDSSVFVPEEDMDTEELERIYRQQGLDRMADEVADIVDDSIEEM